MCSPRRPAGDNGWVSGAQLVDLERFWCSRGQRPSLTAEGYLVDPAGPPGVLLNSSLRRTGETITGRCTILLGEPGTGKSTVSRQIAANRLDPVGRRVLRYDLAAYSSDMAVISQVFDHRNVVECVALRAPALLVWLIREFRGCVGRAGARRSRSRWRS
jgi:hypothetical protein